MIGEADTIEGKKEKERLERLSPIVVLELVRKRFAIIQDLNQFSNKSNDASDKFVMEQDWDPKITEQQSKNTVLQMQLQQMRERVTLLMNATEEDKKLKIETAISDRKLIDSVKENKRKVAKIIDEKEKEINRIKKFIKGKEKLKKEVEELELKKIRLKKQKQGNLKSNGWTEDFFEMQANESWKKSQRQTNKKFISIVEEDSPSSKKILTKESFVSFAKQKNKHKVIEENAEIDSKKMERELAELKKKNNE